MAEIVGGIAPSHTPTIGFALDAGKQKDPVWAPIFKGYEPVRQWLADTAPDVLFYIFNDHMTSFYTFCPSGFMVECGWGGASIDPETWEPHQVTDGPSLWGHERAWLPPEGRERAREMRFDAARRGVRYPVEVLPGNLSVAQIDQLS